VDVIDWKAVLKAIHEMVMEIHMGYKAVERLSTNS
jgi:hypothetical protein